MSNTWLNREVKEEGVIQHGNEMRKKLTLFLQKRNMDGLFKT